MEAYEHKNAIDQWMQAILRDGGITRMDDLHIDKIDPLWGLRENWLDAGLESLRLALGLRDLRQLPLTIGLGFSLKPDDRGSAASFKTREEFLRSLNSSPPSLYMFREGEAPSRKNSSGAQRLDPVVLGATSDLRCYYLEFFQHNERYRSVFIEG